MKPRKSIYRDGSIEYHDRHQNVIHNPDAPAEVTDVGRSRWRTKGNLGREDMFSPVIMVPTWGG